MKDISSYTLRQVDLLYKEIENKKLQQAINVEGDADKREILVEAWVRDRGWARLAKQTFGTDCMIDGCGNTFLKRDGTSYNEVHHIKPLYAGGEDGIWNLAVLCAHHHRMAHFADNKVRRRLRRGLQNKNEAFLAELETQDAH